MPDYVDIHSHLHFPEYDADRADVIGRMAEKNIWTVTVGTNLETSRSAVVLAKDSKTNGTHAGIFACVGLHPADDPAAPWDERAFSDLACEEKVVAIGECGLDYARVLAGDESTKRRQREIFEAQIALAIAVDKPLMIHCRDAYADTYDILAHASHDKLRGNMHFFAGDTETAKKFIDIGFTLSFTGVITFATQYEDVVRFVPLEYIMSETDAPFVAPAPFRGRRNEPAHVIEVVKAIARIKNLDQDTARHTLVANAVRVFGLK